MKRDIALDILRAIALLCIILIHIRPDNIIVNQLRSFDVPMMVFLSGVSYSLSSSGGGVKATILATVLNALKDLYSQLGYS